jgi:predicted transcriptional regulator
MAPTVRAFHKVVNTQDIVNPRWMDDAALAFVERFGELFVEGGMPRMPARVFACLLVSERGAMEAGELSAELGISPAAVSGAVRYLLQVGMIVRERPLGSRRDVYRLLDNSWYEMFARRDQLLLRWADGLTSGVEALGADSPGGARLQESVDFFRYLAGELPLVMERWRASRPG